MFIAEIQEQHLLPVEKVFISEDVITEFQIVQFTESEAPEIGRIEEDFITALLDRFVMNVTALNNYLKCPLEFYYLFRYFLILSSIIFPILFTSSS